ncbi:MAG: hypothetical protein ABL958_03575 [Bdellovibrionia bacterium]
MERVRVRFAREEDAKGILEAHYSAVHETASKDYPSDVIVEWSTPVTEARIKKYLSDSFPDETTLVAEAVYVSAKFARLGVGAKLAARLPRNETWPAHSGIWQENGLH